MHKFGKMICKHRKIILIIAALLLIPAAIGALRTKVNYDILVYLPKDIDTIKGENILADEFDMGAYTIIVLDDNMPKKEILKFEEEVRKLDNVSLCGSIADVFGEAYPIEMMPDEIRDKVYSDGATLMVVTFKDGISEDTTLNTILELREILDERCEISGMSAIIIDTKILSDSEFVIYVCVAAVLCFIVLQIALDSYTVPIFLLLNVGIAILYNLGTNIVLGEISYITKSISAVLQLGVTMDFAIFLYHSYMTEKMKTDDINEAMSVAIGKTLTSVLGSSLTTVAGFLALCTMNFTLGKDIGIVMAKGVICGVICVVTILPAALLECNNLIEKTKHKPFLPEFRHVKNFIMKFYIPIFIVFVILLPFAYKAYSSIDVYYKLDASLPDYLESIKANKSLKDKFDMVSTELLLVSSDLDDSKTNEMLKEIEGVEGIEFTLGIAKLADYGIPKEMIPQEILDRVENEHYQLVIISSNYEVATDELNHQCDVVNEIVKKYDDKAILAGEGALMKDLVQVSDHDFRSVNTMSIGVIFIIMILVLKSVSLPVILISVIEFAIFVNMGIPHYTGVELPFIASIVIGTIQLGATIDYAILFTTKYIENRKDGNSSKEAVDKALGTSIGSIIVSGLCFFGATIGVGVYSKIAMIGSLCTLLARGAIVSMFCVIVILPSCLLLFDKIVCKTTKGLVKIKN